LVLSIESHPLPVYNAGRDTICSTLGIVFLDYQNCYKAAREAFHDDKHDPAHYGNLRPISLANLLASKGPGAFEVVYVGVYCGVANPRKDPKTHAARQKQIAVWRSAGAEVRSRPLRYPPDWALKSGEKPREKGVDVQLSLDAVVMAVEGQYDTAIIGSCDTDLDPLVVALSELKATAGRPQAVEAIAWKGRSNKLSDTTGLVHRWIGDRDYGAIRDKTDYNL
jgi:uncharacterized LabA/DUF88 family protein